MKKRDWQKKTSQELGAEPLEMQADLTELPKLEKTSN